MFFRRFISQGNFLRLGIVLFSTCAIHPVMAGEPAVSTNQAQKPLVLKKKSWLDELMPSYRPGDTVSGKGDNVMIAPPASAPPPTTRVRTPRELEAADREKNWVFLKPNEQKKDPVSGLDQIYEDKIHKSVVLQFLENKEGKMLASSGRTNNSSSNSSRESSSFDPVVNLDGQDTKQENRLSSSPRNSFEYQMPTYGATEAKLADFARQQRELNGHKDRQERLETMRAYENLFKPPGPSGGDTLSLLNSQNILGGSPAVLPGRLAPLDVSSPSLAQSAPRALAGIPGANMPDPGIRVFGASSSPVQAVPTLPPVQQPTILPSPKRRF